MMNPKLIVVTGRAGSGKTTLSRILAREVRCPLISRDEIKEGLVNTVKGTQHSMDLNRHVYHTYFNVLEILLNQHITLITEAAFQHKIWQPKLEALQEIATIKITCCAIDGELAKARFIQRGLSDPERANFHEDLGIQADTDISGTILDNYTPPQLDIPTLTVDTSDGYQPSLETILSFIQADKPVQ